MGVGVRDRRDGAAVGGSDRPGRDPHPGPDDHGVSRDRVIDPRCGLSSDGAGEAVTVTSPSPAVALVITAWFGMR